MIPNTIRQELRISDFKKARKRSAVIRENTINEAITFHQGVDIENKEYTSLYKHESYDIGVSKPGKEVFEFSHKNFEGGKTNNKNDMMPTIRLNGENTGITPTFTEIFNVFEDLMHDDSDILEIIGGILTRLAFLVDHKDINGSFRLDLPKDSTDFLKSKLTKLGDIPIEVFFYMLEVLALNEDVKYLTLGYNTITLGYGRRNNLLTYSYLIAVFLRRARLSKFAGTLSRPPSGVAPLPQKDIFECFPVLK